MNGIVKMNDIVILYPFTDITIEKLFDEVHGIKASQIKGLGYNIYLLKGITEENVADIFDSKYEGFILNAK